MYKFQRQSISFLYRRLIVKRIYIVFNKKLKQIRMKYVNLFFTYLYSTKKTHLRIYFQFSLKFLFEILFFCISNIVSNAFKIFVFHFIEYKNKKKKMKIFTFTQVRTWDTRQCFSLQTICTYVHTYVCIFVVYFCFDYCCCFLFY